MITVKFDFGGGEKKDSSFDEPMKGLLTGLNAFINNENPFSPLDDMLRNKKRYSTTFPFGAPNEEPESKEYKNSLADELEHLQVFFQELAGEILEIKEPRVFQLELISKNIKTSQYEVVSKMYIKETEIAAIQRINSDAIEVVSKGGMMYEVSSVTPVEGTFAEIIEKVSAGMFA